MSRNPLTDDELYTTFLTVARCGSMTGAGQQMYLTHPAVHYRILRLEHREGSKLFTRHTGNVERNMRLTRAGEALRDRLA